MDSRYGAQFRQDSGPLSREAICERGCPQRFFARFFDLDMGAHAHSGPHVRCRSLAPAPTTDRSTSAAHPPRASSLQAVQTRTGFVAAVRGTSRVALPRRHAALTPARRAPRRHPRRAHGSQIVPAASNERPSIGRAAGRSLMNDETRHRRIAEAAYYLAQRRGFAPEGMLEDWLAAERDADADTEPLVSPFPDALPSEGPGTPQQVEPSRPGDASGRDDDRVLPAEGPRGL
jgi:hypothetical protein